ncbi:hypothetical protein [Streptantibioticus ferralitis]|uniref:Uncharacterized protein n=1 Tax=Streptantibioticus ferralitis TaxID=236510 RepID=A0ABT5Z4C6_9ACTN|nr:hypothetical protein [Streptantibioticus ferralitis]MDF2258683.1 hypothetical protein [Streptantibioticus ferralitis]
MFVTRALAATVVAGAALGLSAPLAAAAADPSAPNNIIVTPKDVKAGGTLTITVDGSSCRGSGKSNDAIVESSVFSRTALKGIVNQGSSVATVKIFSTAKNGAYKITATCGGKSVTGGDFTVGDIYGKSTVTKSGKTSGSTSSSTSGSTTASTPTKGAKTGVGGSHGGINTVQAALGATLLAAAVTGGGVYLLRRRAGSKY